MTVFDLLQPEKLQPKKPQLKAKVDFFHNNDTTRLKTKQTMKLTLLSALLLLALYAHSVQCVPDVGEQTEPLPGDEATIRSHVLFVPSPWNAADSNDPQQAAAAAAVNTQTTMELDIEQLATAFLESPYRCRELSWNDPQTAPCLQLNVANSG